MQCSIGVYFNEPCKNPTNQLTKSIRDFTENDQFLLKLRTEENNSTICDGHEYKYLQKYHKYFGKYCCNPFDSHTQPITKYLREVTLSFSKSIYFIKLVPGKSLCARLDVEIKFIIK